MRLLLLLTLLLQSQLSGTSWNAIQYAKSNHLQQHWADHFFFSRYQFRGDETVLDIGCGDGALTARIAKATTGQVIGLDNSPSMIAHALTNYAADNLSFKLSQGDDSLFYHRMTNSCDLIVSFHCLHWIQDQDTVLRGIREALVPGGMAFLRFCSKGFDPIQEIVDQLKESPKWAPAFKGFKDPMTRYSAEEYQEKLERYDFEILRLVEAVDTDILESPEKLKQHIIGWLPHYKFLGSQIGELFVNEVRDLYMEKYPNCTGGKILLPDCYLEVEIRRR